MKATVQFTLGFQENHKKIAEDISKELYYWRRQIKEYKTGVQILSLDFYKMDQDHSLYRKIVDFAKRFPEEIALEIYEFYVEYTEDELNNAVAFLPHFMNNFADEYDDSSVEYEECTYCHALLKEVDQLVYVMPKGYVKKNAEKYGVLRIDTREDHFMVLPKVYEKLIAEGIDPKYLRPVYSKKKQILAYELVSDNVLLEKSFKDGNSQYIKTCKNCGSAHYRQSEEEFMYREKTISKEGLEALKEMSLTAEFYNKQRQIIVNKRVHQVIKEYVPDAQFYPVFLENSN